MNVLHVIPSFAPAWRYGGPILTTLRLCQELARWGCVVRVLTTNTDGPDGVLPVDTEREVLWEENLWVRYCKRVYPESVSLTLLRLLPAYVRWADVVHLTAVYNFPTIPTLWLSRRYRKPLVWTPRGALQRWSGSRHRFLKAVWESMCRRVLPETTVLHVTSDREAEESRARMPGVPTVVIPNGVHVPDTVPRVPSDGTFRLLYLGRLDPKKGIENLLEACARWNGRAATPWVLTIAGTGNPDYVRRITQKAAMLGLSGRVRMVGPVGDEEKSRLMADADVAVVPSYTENFAMVVAEALAHGVPVIASRGTPWRRVEEVGCGLWVDNDPESLAEAIERMNRMPLREMGERGRDWMKREFAWPGIAEQMIGLYQRMIQRL